MSTKDEESSLQLERLLPNGRTSDPSSEATLISSSDSRDPPSHEDATLISKRDEQPCSQDDCKGPKTANFNFDCYKWVLNFRERKASEAASSVDTSTLSSSSNASLSPLPVPKPPDGGWGWMIVLGSFMVLAICDGLSYTFGILYSELLIQFQDSRSKTSLVGSIFFGVSMMLGPFASAMTTKYGCRKMTIVGGILSFIGFVLSSFATSINMLCFTFSVVVGVGFSFCFVTSVVIVHFYFDKRRSLATGLAVCGTGVGTFTFAPLMEYLIAEYRCQGLFLIMAAVSLNLVVCGMLFRPLKFTEEERRQLFSAEFEKLPPGRESLELGRYRNISECTSGTDLGTLDEESRTMSMLSLPTFAHGNAANTNESSDILMEVLKNSRNRHLTFQRYMKNAYFRSDSQNEKEEADRAKELVFQDTVTISVDSPPPTLSVSLSDDLQDGKVALCSPADGIATKTDQNNLQYPTSELAPELSKMLKADSQMRIEAISKHSSQHSFNELGELRKHSFNTHSFEDLRKEIQSKRVSKILSGVQMGRHNCMGIQQLLYRTDIFFRQHMMNQVLQNSCLLGTSCPQLVESQLKPGIKSEGFWLSARTCLMKGLGVVVGTVDLHLFRNIFFTAFVISNFIFYFWSDIPYMYAKDHSLDQNIDTERASFLISVIGISNTVGQVIFGLIGDLKINLIIVYTVVLVLSGMFVAIVPFMHTFWSMVVVYSLFGFFVSITFPFSTVLLVNYLGVDQLTSAYGLLMLMQGIANVLGPPFAGWISDITASYDSAFYLSGLFYAVSGLIMFIIFIPGLKGEKTTGPRQEEEV